MTKKEIQQKLNNSPKPEYFYNRYNGELSKWEIDKINKIIIEQTTGFTINYEYIIKDFDINQINLVIAGKSSYNIIDLIEICDYVNGSEVTTILKETGKPTLIVVKNECLHNSNIIGILTHEQLKKLEFIV